MSENSTTANVVHELTWVAGTVVLALAAGYVFKKAYRTGSALKTSMFSRKVKP